MLEAFLDKRLVGLTTAVQVNYLLVCRSFVDKYDWHFPSKGQFALDVYCP